MRYTIGVIAALALAASVSSANAQFYVGGFGGLSIQGDSTLEDRSGTTSADLTLDFDAGFVFGGVGGYRFDFGGGNSIDAEVEVSYRSNSMDSGTLFGFTAPISGDLDSISLMVNGWYNFGTGTPFTPYVGGGAGVVIIETNDVAVGGTTFADDDDTVFGGQIGAGVAYAVTSKIDLTLDYRFLITTEATFTKLAVDADFTNHTIRAGVRMRF